MSVDYEKIRQLVAIVERNQLTELAVEEDGISITIKAEAGDMVCVSMPVGQAGAPIQVQSRVTPGLWPSQEKSLAEGLGASAENLFEIKSPMIGVFYRAPSPDAPPYTDVGDELEVGQTIGLIEAMKVFSEVPSEVAGRVVAIQAGNSKLVQQGDILAVVDTLGTSSERNE